MLPSSRWFGLLVGLVVAGCAETNTGDQAEQAEEAENVGTSSQAVGASSKKPDKKAAKYERAPRTQSEQVATVNPPIPGGIAADSDTIFIGSPLDGRVLVLSRETGAQIAELPQPPGNFILPLILHSIGPSRVAVLDTGGFPAPGEIDAQPTIYEYTYSQHDGVFSAQLARTVSFAGHRIGYAEEFAYLGGGKYLVPDSVYGAIWRVNANGSVERGLGPKTYDAADAIPELAYCPTMPQITVGGFPFLFTGSTVPGVAGIAVRDGTVFFYSSCSASLYRIPLSSLSDNRTPWKRTDDIKLIASKPVGVEIEEILDMQFNPYDSSDKYLYAADALQLQFIRIDPNNGKRQILGDDPHLFNFPSSLAFLPPSAPGCGHGHGHGHDDGPELLVFSNQQHRDPLLNSALNGEDYTQPPYVVTQVKVGR
jgi:hypothetical protein